MPYIQLIHWNATEVKEKAARLKAAEYLVSYDLPNGPPFLRKMKEKPPSAVIIDLNRLPSQGRDIALALRQNKSTRQVPLIFVEGDPEKVMRIKKLLPDALYTTWSRIRSSLKQAMAHPPAKPVTPKSVFDAYAGTPLIKKLGIKSDSMVMLTNAPPGFEHKLGKLPPGATVQRTVNRDCNLTIWFTTSTKGLRSGIKRMGAVAVNGKLWIVWPKKTARKETDLSQQIVRDVGLAAGLVDYKICAIDDTWSGLLFTRRKSK